MAKPNYSFQKRQKELARQAKKEEKRLRKLNRDHQPDVEEPGPPDDSAEPGSEG